LVSEEEETIVTETFEIIDQRPKVVVVEQIKIPAKEEFAWELIEEEKMETTEQTVVGAQREVIETYAEEISEKSVSEAIETAIHTQLEQEELAVKQEFEVVMVEEEMPRGIVEEETVVSESASTLSDTYPPVFKRLLHNTAVELHQPLKLECTVMGGPSPIVEWYQNGQLVKPSAIHKIQYDRGVAVLELAEVREADVGEYICVAFNDYGEAETRAMVTTEGTEVSDLI